MPVGSYKQISAIKEGVIIRLQCNLHCNRYMMVQENEIKLKK